jgi:ribonucleoside-diphosphate reductase alpha chain
VWEKTPKALAAYLKIDSIDELPYWAMITSQNIEFEERAAVQATIQNYVDTAISSTFNLPNEATIQDIIDIYHSAHDFGLKGATVFRDNCAKVGILSGVEGWQVDKNPAPKPKILITETWVDKENGVTTTTDKVFTVDGVENIDKPKIIVYNSEVLDICPLCGAPLVKQGGCHKCSDNECDYERCDI